MPVGLSDGTSYNDSADWFAASVSSQTDKQRSDQAEININSTAGDFQSRFYATDASTMPPQASTELAGALKQTGSTQVPGSDEKVKIGDKLPNGETVKFTTVNPLFNITEEDIDRGMNVAMSAGPGTMAGVTSKTLDKGALEVAQAAEKQGLNPNEIWEKTGFFRGADKRWRYEIDDSGSVLKTPEFKKSEFGNYQAKLGNVLEHPELYKAYPGIENVPVNILPWYPSKGAFWNGSSIGMGVEAAKNKSTLMHEVQHAIQDREAFAQGGAPGKIGKDFKLMYEDEVNKLRKPLFDLQDRMNKGELLTSEERAKLDYLGHVFSKYTQYARAGEQKAREHYMALAGETEARNVETRLPLEPQDRLKISPMSTEDTARAEQIVRDKPTLTTPYKDNGGFLSY